MTMVTPPGDLYEPPASRKASLIVLEGWEIGREIEVAGPEVVIGRAANVSAPIPVPSISRQHAKIVRVTSDDNNYYEIVDLGSMNGTRVNNNSVESIRLENGDRIQMGDVLLRFVLRDSVDERYHQEVHRLIHYDQLTGLLKLTAFKQQLEADIQKADSSTKFVLAMTDLDGLKKVNDTYGHAAGAMVVREMGQMIRDILRPDDRGGLFGGDETMLYFPNTAMDEAKAITERLRTTIEGRIFEMQGHRFQVSISQGLAEWPLHGNSMESILAAADGALYAAKAAGRNCIRVAGE
ncbi:MAG: GGDEF domain-containing protein [Candidatus Hydrogenedentes bacterium]|nr:GGDEF domain-containing protein [Candidatus Hydrogenedentota bacterium]